MNSNSKAILFCLLVFFGTFIAIYLSLKLVFPEGNNAILTGITTLVSVVLSPRRKIIQKQSGDEVQLKWIFSKTIIIIK